MIFFYQFHELAQKDYEDSLSWYLSRSEDAVKAFVNAVDFAIAKICNHPTRYRDTYAHYYEIPLKKFPFILIYSMVEKNSSVIIWKIYHYKRNPKKKYSQLKKK